MPTRRNLIFNAFAFKEDYLNAPAIGSEKVSDRTIDIYIKNAYVSLFSAKAKNPQDDVALVTNCELPFKYKDLFMREKIKIIKIEFNDFVMPKTFVWSLAFFKLCALKCIVNNNNYEKILLLDPDTITVYNYKELWMEADHGLLLYNINHSYANKYRKSIVQNYQHLYQNDKNLVHYGGEFIGGTNKVLKNFIEKCDKVYKVIKENNFNISNDAGDETIISIAAIFLNNVIEAGAYIYRYWTYPSFFLISTNYKINPVAIWHLPAEKKEGMIRIYNHLQRRGVLPSIEKMARIFGFPRATRLNILTILRWCYIKVKGICRRATNVLLNKTK